MADVMPAPSEGLRRDALGVIGIIVMSAVLMGPAISLFFNVPVMAGSAGVGVPIAFAISMVGILLTAYTVAQYARKVASAGSFYGFVRAAAGERGGFLVGWFTFGAYLGSSIGGGIICGVFVSSLMSKLGWDVSYFWSALLVFAVTLVLNLRGIRISERISVIMLAIEVIAIVVVVGAILIKGGADGLSTAPLTLSETSMSGIRLAMVFGILSFVGFEISATLAEETRNPLRNVPIAVLGCTIVVGVIYLVGSYAVVIGYGTDNMDVLASDGSSFSTLAEQYAPIVSPVVDVVVISALLGAVVAIVNSFGRVAYALGRDEVLPRWLGRTHHRYQTPWAALLVPVVGGIVVTGLLAASGVEGLNAYSYVSTPASLLLIVVFIAANLLVCKLYRAHRSEFSVVKHVVVPVIGSLVLLLPLIAQFYPQPAYPLNLLPAITGAWIVVGVVLLVVRRKRIDSLGDAPFAGLSEDTARTDTGTSTEGVTA